MTEKQIRQILNQLPKNESIDRFYSAFEGGLRVISKDENGRETRYNVLLDADGNVRLEKF